MMIIRGIHRVFRVELSIRRYRARFCNGLRPLIYKTDPLPVGYLSFETCSAILTLLCEAVPVSLTSKPMSTAEVTLSTRIEASQEVLDAWVREVIQWHFDPVTGCPFWLDYAQNLGWDPRERIQTYQDVAQLGPFQDEWLRGGPVRR